MSFIKSIHAAVKPALPYKVLYKEQRAQVQASPPALSIMEKEIFSVSG